MRLIDADELVAVPNVCKLTEYDETGSGISYNAVPVKAIYDAPTIEAEPVRHAIYDAGGDCTNCGYPMPTDDRLDAIFPDEIKYCYHCGAKMDAKEDDHE